MAYNVEAIYHALLFVSAQVMTTEDNTTMTEYRRKAEECLEIAHHVDGAHRALFLQLAQSWAKLALQYETPSPLTANIDQVISSRAGERSGDSART